MTSAEPERAPGCDYSGESKPLVIVLSGPSGVGKDAVLSRMNELGSSFHFVVTLTTRERRPEEVNGRDYVFVSRAQFEAMRAAGELLEWAEVYGNLYGVPAPPVRQALAEGRDVLIKVDVQGAATIKRRLPEAVLIFLVAASMEELKDRLRRRETESPLDLELRLKAAQREMERRHDFDHVVVNADGRLDEAVANIEAIVAAEKRRLALADSRS